MNAQLIRFRKPALYLLAGFYVVAGLNHFVNPDFYLPLIPPWLPAHTAINFLSGIAEVLLGIALLPLVTRRLAGYGILLLLLFFIPAHIHFIRLGGCVSDGLCVPAWIAWVRLLVVHPLLLLWAWWCTLKQ
ncbi:MAG TPA: hypothetical protein PKE63_12230 [Lacibacter sp.]|nr:hypothetical protein [Lacibacter sp.]HMO87660.1 hypothetical protein [Lacibacter sp.]HMP88037.1 hypothetical protein [Lacibacter sp.]